MSRGGFKVRRADYSEHESGNRVDWLDSFARKVEEISDKPRNAVEVARSRDYRSLVEQISSIMSRRPATQNAVETKVQELQQRTGLTEWLRRQAQAAEAEMKTGEEELPQLFKKLSPEVQENVKAFIANLIATHHGNIHVPAIVEEVSKTFRGKGIQPQDVNDMLFEKYISDQIVKAKKNEPIAEEQNINIGRGIGIDTQDMDAANIDAFEGLNPVKT